MRNQERQGYDKLASEIMVHDRVCLIDLREIKVLLYFGGENLVTFVII